MNWKIYKKKLNGLFVHINLYVMKDYLSTFERVPNEPNQLEA